jgi:hypothetical protein
VAQRDLKAFRANGHAADGQGITPLEVMLKAMRAAHARGDLAAAAAFARDAAPYVHPRLTSAEVAGGPGAYVNFVNPVKHETGRADR